MLEAELHGKGGDELEQKEDLLTSAVLGLLQYVPMAPFWRKLLGKAKSLDGESFDGRCHDLGVDLDRCNELKLHFWCRHQTHGEPDVLVAALGPENRPLAFVVEVKLWAERSGVGEEDQLNKYLAALKDGKWLARPPISVTDAVLPGLIYLTPRPAYDDLQGSVDSSEDKTVTRKSLFILQWQDVFAAAEETANAYSPPHSDMLMKVAQLLDRRGLVYFSGFAEPICGTEELLEHAQFYTAENRFQGFERILATRVPERRASFYRRVGI